MSVDELKEELAREGYAGGAFISWRNVGDKTGVRIVAAGLNDADDALATKLGRAILDRFEETQR